MTYIKLPSTSIILWLPDLTSQLSYDIHKNLLKFITLTSSFEDTHNSIRHYSISLLAQWYWLVGLVFLWCH